MNRKEAIALARRHAIKRAGQNCYDYQPKTAKEAEAFNPHYWVTDAMMDAAQLGRLEAHPWINAALQVPDAVKGDEHWNVCVLGVVDDPRYRINGDDPFIDTVHWWPAVRKWTITHSAECDTEAADYECIVTYWQHKPELPPFKKMSSPLSPMDRLKLDSSVIRALQLRENS